MKGAMNACSDTGFRTMLSAFADHWILPY